MPRTADPALAETGLSEDVVAASCARVFGLMLGQADPAGEEIGWEAVVRASSDVLGGTDDSEVVLNLPELSDFLRLAYGRAVDPDFQLSPTASLSESVRLGWQAVTRHILNVFALDPQEARKLEQHEAEIVAFVKKRSATPKAP